MKPSRERGISLTNQIFIGLLLGAVFGHIFPAWVEQLKPIGDMFIRMIKMIIVPLILSSLIMGIASNGDFKKLGRLGAKAIIWFELATTLALIVGLVVVNWLQPGLGVHVGEVDTKIVAVAAKKSVDLLETVVNIIPTNIVDGMVRGDMLQIVVFSCFFGLSAATMGDKAKPVVALATSVAEIMFKFTDYVMRFAPFGVFALISYTVSKFGLAMLFPLAKLVGSLYLGLIIFILVVLIGTAAVIRINFFKLMRVIKEPILIAFSTASSEAALPTAMEKLERFGVPKHIVNFVLPTGYIFNLDGSTLYIAMAIVFVAQMFNIPFDLSQQILMSLSLMLSTKGLAAVPGTAIIVIAGTAAAFGLPLEGIALLMGIDRILDMGRTTCNVIGNCVAAVIIARWENELPDDTLQEAYTPRL